VKWDGRGSVIRATSRKVADLRRDCSSRDRTTVRDKSTFKVFQATLTPAVDLVPVAANTAGIFLANVAADTIRIMLIHVAAQTDCGVGAVVGLFCSLEENAFAAIWTTWDVATVAERELRRGCPVRLCKPIMDKDSEEECGEDSGVHRI
jgi:hypothetical protein